MDNIPVIMLIDDLTEIPVYNLPEGFQAKTYRNGDECEWARIEHSVGEFKGRDEALKHFNIEFGPFLSEFQERCLFIETDNGEKIATATAWYNEDFLGKRYGRLHWVAVIPEYQGKKLGKSLVHLTMERMKRYHDCVYLTTQTTSQPAVSLYLDFGFVPFVEDTESLRGWRILVKHLRHPKLKDFE